MQEKIPIFYILFPKYSLFSIRYVDIAETQVFNAWMAALHLFTICEIPGIRLPRSYVCDERKQMNSCMSR